MKCLVCPNTIDETKSFLSKTKGRQGQDLEDSASKEAHGQELERWRQVTLSASTDGASVTLIAGHVCPSEDLGALAIATSSAAKAK